MNSENNPPSEPVQKSTSTPKTKGGSRIIGRLLPAAIRLWLKSQTEQAEALSVEIEGRDRQILAGEISGVSVSAQQAIYQGIALSQLQLSANDISINIRQVIRGKPLRLLKSFPVLGKVVLTEADLNVSLSSSLLGTGLKDFWRSLLQAPDFATIVEERYGQLALREDLMLKAAQIRLCDHSLALSFYPQTTHQTAQRPIVLATALTLIEEHYLQLTSPHWLETIEELTYPIQGQPIKVLDGYQWDLGKDTQLKALTIQTQQLHCTGQLIVKP